WQSYLRRPEWGGRPIRLLPPPSLINGTRAACPTSHMYCSHLVRVGVMGNVGRFVSPDAVHYPRGARVIIRTPRGLEIGEVLGDGADSSPDLADADGALLRAMTAQDELLE